MDKHPNPYKLGWIRNGEVAKVINTCVVPLAIRKSYAYMVLCDMVEMDATHIILGRPWQFYMHGCGQQGEVESVHNTSQR